MLNSRDYTIFDLIVTPFRIIPVQTLAAILYMLLDALMPAYQTLVIAYFINTATEIFNGRADYSLIVKPIALIMGYVIVTHLFPSLMQIVDLTGRNKLNVTLKKEIVLKRARLEYKHIENNDTWELIHRVCGDPVGYFMNGFNNILSGMNLLIGTASLLVIVMSSTFITGIVIVLVAVPLFYIAIKTGRENYAMGLDAHRIRRKYNDLADILTNRDYAEERTLFGYSSAITDKYDKLYKESYTIEKQIQIRTFVNLKSGSMIALLIGIVIVGLLLPPLNQGELSIGLFISLVTAIFSLVQRMSWQLSDTMQQHARIKEYLKDFSEFAKLSEKEDAEAVPVKVDGFIFHSLEFKNVGFQYPGTDRSILKNCSFRMVHGKTYAFVGENGAGKTTIIKLLTGMYDDYEGEIFINDKNLREYSFAELKGFIAVVFQNFSKYALTVKDNIRLGNILKHDEEDIRKSISEMNLNGMIQGLEFGLDTYVGKMKENSVDLSGGQWQRLAIARLLYSDSAIHILDEPTAALDPIEESKLYELFSRINTDRFTIFITHRLGAARISDEILVVSEGRIAEQGSHEQLMGYPSGMYQKMFASQRSWYEAESKVHYG
ncbi:ABC transporter ATP-binding protein [Paenibacillus tritici]|uniref:ABC transporter ATP-binding protein n=1 Tax=Paenibacillus tritici TaxID=1873425 RepID=A0ABX2DIF1_9BACL|nr:ABC transporter ATP-binding protein [Paenibacillus tritici]NQX44396.1 ABC transporter ATP-binding protein [Paenibacillus tritici]